MLWKIPPTLWAASPAHPSMSWSSLEVPQQTHSCALGMAECIKVVNLRQLPQTKQPKPSWPLSSLTDIKFDGHWAGHLILANMCPFWFTLYACLYYKKGTLFLLYFNINFKTTDKLKREQIGWQQLGVTEHPEFPHAGEYPVVGSLWGMLHGILQS